jgi:hypothetical protein
MRILFTILLIGIYITSFSQNVFKSEIDSLAFIDSLRTELRLLLDSKTAVSFTDVNVSIGNGFFIPRKNNPQFTSVNKSLYSLNTAYYNKSGLGISFTGQFIYDNKKINMYQAAITPSFDYLNGKNIGFGFSFSRFFIKDSLSYYTSPLKNDFYGYITLKNTWVRPTLAFDFSNGTQKDYIQYNPRRPGILVSSNISDFSMLFTLQKEVDIVSIFSDDDVLTFAPSIMLTAGTFKYGPNLPVGNIPIAIQRAYYNNVNTSSVTNSFKLQSFSTILMFEYNIGMLYLRPQLFLDYSIPKETSSWNALYNVTLGYIF